jgi:tripartite-type tricarboxylate transporter receptor subunit TctC
MNHPPDSVLDANILYVDLRMATAKRRIFSTACTSWQTNYFDNKIISLECCPMRASQFIARLMFTAITLSSAGVSYGQAYPSKPVRIVTAAPGGGVDFTARLMALGLTANLGQQFVVDNRGGTHVSAITVANAVPDGYTLLIHNNTIWTAPLIEKPAYSMAQLLPVVFTSRSPNILVVHPTLAVNSVKELIALAKAKPGDINYASGPAGSANYLAAELFKYMAGVNLVRISYKGGGPAVNDLIAGQVKVMFATTGSVTPHVKSGRLRALAVTSPEPSALAPGLPTVAASGVPGYELQSIYGIFVPLKTPPAIVARLNQETRRFLEQPDTKERFLSSGVETVGSTPQEFAAAVAADTQRIQKVIQAAGLRVE